MRWWIAWKQVSSGSHFCVTDDYANRIKILAPNKSLLLMLGSDRGEIGPGEFDCPEGVAIRGGEFCIMADVCPGGPGKARDD